VHILFNDLIYEHAFKQKFKSKYDCNVCLNRFLKTAKRMNTHVFLLLPPPSAIFKSVFLALTHSIVVDHPIKILHYANMALLCYL